MSKVKIPLSLCDKYLHTFYASDAQFMFMFTNTGYDPKKEYALVGQNPAHFV